jgi:hypothetical protein
MRGSSRGKAFDAHRRAQQLVSVLEQEHKCAIAAALVTSAASAFKRSYSLPTGKLSNPTASNGIYIVSALNAEANKAAATFDKIRNIAFHCCGQSDFRPGSLHIAVAAAAAAAADAVFAARGPSSSTCSPWRDTQCALHRVTRDDGRSHVIKYTSPENHARMWSG